MKLDGLDPALVRRLTRPLRHPTLLIGFAVPERIFSAVAWMRDRLPLLSELVQRRGGRKLDPSVPIVHARALPPESRVVERVVERNTERVVVQAAPVVPRRSPSVAPPAAHAHRREPDGEAAPAATAPREPVHPIVREPAAARTQPPRLSPVFVPIVDARSVPAAEAPRVSQAAPPPPGSATVEPRASQPPPQASLVHEKPAAPADGPRPERAGEPRPAPRTLAQIVAAATPRRSGTPTIVLPPMPRRRPPQARESVQLHAPTARPQLAAPSDSPPPSASEPIRVTPHQEAAETPAVTHAVERSGATPPAVTPSGEPAGAGASPPGPGRARARAEQTPLDATPPRVRVRPSRHAAPQPAPQVVWESGTMPAAIRGRIQFLPGAAPDEPRLPRVAAHPARPRAKAPGESPSLVHTLPVTIAHAAGVDEKPAPTRAAADAHDRHFESSMPRSVPPLEPLPPPPPRVPPIDLDALAEKVQTKLLRQAQQDRLRRGLQR